MKLKFKKQAYQTNAVEAVADCFARQPLLTGWQHRIDPGTDGAGNQRQLDPTDALFGFRNAEIVLSRDQLLENVQHVQRRQNLPISPQLVSTSASEINLDIEMETGTGKTYCYIKTMFELHKRYGWSKFIVVVPSIAIREGVKKSLEITAEHFLEEYGKRARFFVYDSKHPYDVESFSSDDSLNVMIINVQAFHATGKDARRIYEELDDFQSRRPIDVIKNTRPILILDEPQKMEGKKTVEALARFEPLFVLRYSATHKSQFNKIFRLDALDAYQQKLVKKIAVRGISVRQPSGADAYLYLQSIQVSADRPPIARLELEVKRTSGIKRVIRLVKRNDNLQELSKGLEQYRGYVVADVDAVNDTVSFTNGVELRSGDVRGDMSERTLRRIQIREAIGAHLEKEAELYPLGIKVLSLFFIDEVARYRQYDENGYQPGEYARIFEEEYQQQVQEVLARASEEYSRYLQRIPVDKTHEGYFSIDKKTNRMVDPKFKRKGETQGETDDVAAYDLILKNKERLLSLDEPVRFIFSHSALREGWDNPNVFVICALKQSENTISRRQEVGRGLRLAVNQAGNRLDDPATVHQVNVLTVVASESYQEFVAGLQQDWSESLSARPRTANRDYFTGKVLQATAKKMVISADLASALCEYLATHGYVDSQEKISPTYHEARQSGQLAPLPPELHPYAEQVFALIDGVVSDIPLPLPSDDRRSKQQTHEDVKRREFYELWNRIHQQSACTVHFDSAELVRKCVAALDERLNVAPLHYTVQRGEQLEQTSFEALQQGAAFRLQASVIEAHRAAAARSTVKYDLLGKLASETQLTRRTVAEILRGVKSEVFEQFSVNPEDFLLQAARLINEQKGTAIVEHLRYDQSEQRYESVIFAEARQLPDFARLLAAVRPASNRPSSVTPCQQNMVTDSTPSGDVVVYSRLPRSFQIPTPIGQYSPDWAFVFQEGNVKHVYFVAEAKGTLSSLQLREVDECKVDSARKFLAKLRFSPVKYDVADSYSQLLELVS
jgi:type III restriction enzyme